MRLALTTRIALAVLIAALVYQPVVAQSTVEEDHALPTALAEHLEGLRLLGLDELEGQQISMDGESIPVYTRDGDRVRGMEMMKLMMSGEYMPSAYVDDDKEVRAFVLREATEEEKRQLAAMQTEAEGEHVGENAAKFKVTDIQGVEHDSEKLLGKIVVLNFWFIGCKPCVMEMPELTELVQEFAEEDVVFLALTHDSTESVNKFLSEHDFAYNIVADDSKVTAAFSVSGFPTSVVIDQQGVIAAELTGYSPGTKAMLAAKVRELLEVEGD